MRKLIILGACGSIGRQTLDIARRYPDKFKVIALSVGRDLELSKKIIDEFTPELVCFREKEHISLLNYHNNSVYGDNGLISLAKYGKDKDTLLVNALVGAAGLKPTVAAIENGTDVALANKETLVIAGDFINALLKEHNVKLYPIDSEHSAIWQCLNGEPKKDVKRLIITASGGSFRSKTRDELVNVTVKDALNHPNWSMGPKITIDSATMMNKGFEVIEAHHLFHIPYENISTILHKESIVHSMVEYNDSNIKALLGVPDMRIPILYALNYPEHVEYDNQALDLIKVGTLHFEELSMERFPCLKMAYFAAKKGGLYPAVLNASNEAAVKLFLNGKIPFLTIEKIISEELAKDYDLNPTLEDVIACNEKVQKEILSRFGVEE